MMSVNILVVGNDISILDDLEKSLTHPQINIDSDSSVPKQKTYDFYVLCNSENITKSLDTIKKNNDGNPIYLYGSICDKSIPIREIVKCNISGCLESKKCMQSFVSKVRTLRKRISKIHEASCKLDKLQSGDLKALAREMKKTKANRFVDFIQSHPLPMVLVSDIQEVLHANAAMEEMIGIRLEGVPISTYWESPEALQEVLCILKKEGRLLGKEVALKNVDGKLLRVKLYTSLHFNEAGNWINSRCLFVPISEEPELPQPSQTS